MASNNVLSLIAGVVEISIGVAIWWNRERLASRVQQNASNSHSDNQQVSKPFWIAIVGVVFVLMGVSNLIMALFRHTW